MAFKDALRNLRKQDGITQADLARILGISKSTISMYECGKREPDFETLEAIADHFNVDMNRLTGRAPDNIMTFPSNVSAIRPMKSIPLIGNIACGEPILAEQNVDGNVFVPNEINADFALRCIGDSMIGADILDGDMVYIQQTAEIVNGKIYAVMFDGIESVATLKHVYYDKDHGSLTLTADNPAYPPRIITGSELSTITILGRAVGFTRKIV